MLYFYDRQGIATFDPTLYYSIHLFDNTHDGCVMVIGTTLFMNQITYKQFYAQYANHILIPYRPNYLFRSLQSMFNYR